MSTGKGDAKNVARNVKIAPRKLRSKQRAANWKSGRRERPEATVIRGKPQHVSNKKAARRITERPEFNIGNPHFFLDQIAKELDTNRFGYLAEFLNKKTYLEELDLTDAENVEKSLGDLVTERAKTLVREKDGKHFVACVSYLTGYVHENGLPKELSSEVTDAMKDYAVELFANHDHSPEEIHDELEKFYTLELLNSTTLGMLPEIREAIGKRLVTYFEKRDITAFGGLLFVCRLLGIVYMPSDQIQSQLQKHALSWLDDEFANKEKDPRDTLILLSHFMEKFENMGVELSARQVREKPGLLAKVQSALASIQSSEEVDEETETIIREIRGTFSTNSWRRLFW